MSIFTRIKDAIFGHSASENRPAKPTTVSTPAAPTTVTTAPPDIPASPANAAWDRASSPAPAHVDVEAQLTAMASSNPQQLNWRTSLVDLMKLVGIDSSLEARQSLARELGYGGDPHDSAKMNVWLHKRVMQELEKNGGKVPASLVA
jgi:hypothetical protein